MNNVLTSVLIAYFSATGTTANVAKNLASTMNAPMYEIVPAQKYTSDDLNWHDENSRTSLEMNGVVPYPELANLDAKIKDYDVIMLGFPIWWGSSPKIVNQFVKSYDFSGKKIVLFATSGSSGLGNIATDLQKDAVGNPEIISWRVLNGNPSTSDLKKYLETLNF
ncbi:MAG: NAD(P)H-dependent oxidoreductase [Alphaproteobacteria bacterium]|nr:NAD(P)H-dependent oxidoreductase [Alphaproteobacteria bacterium]